MATDQIDQEDQENKTNAESPSRWWQLAFAVNMLLFLGLGIIALRNPFVTSFYESLFESKAPSFNTHYHEALELFRIKNYQKSYAMLKKVDDTFLDNSERHAYLLLIALVQSRIAGSSADPNTDPNTDPNNFATIKNRSAALGNLKSATDLVNLPVNHLVSGLIHENINNHRKALLAYYQAVRSEPDNQNFIKSLVNHYFRTGNLNEAIKWNHTLTTTRTHIQEDHFKGILLKYFKFRNESSSFSSLNTPHEPELPSLIEQNQNYLVASQIIYILYKLRNIINHYETYSTLDNYSFDLYHTSPDPRIISEFATITKLLSQSSTAVASKELLFLEFSKNLWNTFLLVNNYESTINLNTSMGSLQGELQRTLSTLNAPELQGLYAFLQGDLSLINGEYFRAREHYQNASQQATLTDHQRRYLYYHQALANFHLREFNVALDQLYSMNSVNPPALVTNVIEQLSTTRPNDASPALEIYRSTLQRKVMETHIQTLGGTSISKANSKKANFKLTSRNLGIPERSLANHDILSPTSIDSKVTFKNKKFINAFGLFAEQIITAYQNQQYNSIIKTIGALPLLKHSDFPQTPMSYDEAYFLLDYFALALTHKEKLNEATKSYETLLLTLEQEIKNLQSYDYPAFNRIVQLRKLIAQTLNNLAWVQVRKAESQNQNAIKTFTSYVLAEDLFKKATRISGNGIYFYNLYRLYKSINMDIIALQAITHAGKNVMSIPDKWLQVEVLLTAAQEYAQKNIRLEAQRYLKNAQAIDPNDPRIHYFIERGFSRKKSGA